MTQLGIALGVVKASGLTCVCVCECESREKKIAAARKILGSEQGQKRSSPGVETDPVGYLHTWKDHCINERISCQIKMRELPHTSGVTPSVWGGERSKVVQGLRGTHGHHAVANFLMR